MASNAAAAPAHPPPSFSDRLPLELIKAIVAEVDAQDKRFRYCGDQLHSASLPDEEYDSDDDYRPVSKDADIPGNCWPAAHGRGIRMLSLVSRTLRRLAIPYLFKTTNDQKLNSISFRHVVAQPHILAAVQHVDIKLDRLNEGLSEAARVLPQLPNVTSLGVFMYHDNELLSFFEAASSDPRDEWASLEDDEREEQKEETRQLELARCGLHACLAKITSLAINSSKPDGITSILGNPALRKPLDELRLDLSDPSLYMDDQDGLLRAIEHVNPKKLTLCGGGLNGFHASWADLRLPRLSSLTVDTDTLPIDALDKLPKAPHLETLRLIGYYDSPTSVPPLPHFPRLSRLHFDAPGDKPLLLLSAFSSSPVHTLSVTVHEGYVAVALAKFMPLDNAYPPSLRAVRVGLCTERRPSSRTEFVNAMAAKGIAAAVEWGPGLPLFTSAGWSARRVERVLDGELHWARGEVRRLTAVGDTQGMVELLQVFERLRHKRAISSM